MNNLESELDLAKYDAEDRSCMEEKKWKDTSSKELETGQNNEVLSTKKIKKRKRKKKKKSHNASEDKHIQEAGDMPCPDLTSNKKRKKNKKRHNASADKHIQEAGDMPHPELTSNKDIRKDDLNSVLDVAELESARIEKNHEVPSVNSSITERLSSFPKSLDACSIKKHGDHAEVDNSPENIKTYKRRKRAKTSRRKRSKVSDSLGNSLEPIKDDGGSSIQAVQSSSTRETSFDSSGEGTTMQVAEDISMEVASVNCSDGKPEAEESKKRMEVKNVEETGNEDGFVKDVAVLNITEQHFEQENRGKLDKIQIAVQDGIHVEEILDESPTCCKQKVFDNPSGCDHSHKHLEQKNVEIETKMEEIIPSMLHLGAIKDDVGLVVINNEDNSLKVSHSSLERAPIGCSNKKLLILDVNGLLADIVPYVPDGYKPDITISKKAVFKRPFCEEFLRFCFEKFCVGVWTSRTKRNVDRVLDFLMGDSKHNLLFCWDQFHCTDTGYNTIENRDKPLLLKELKKLWEKHGPDLPWEKGEYNESNTLLLDDSPYKALRNPAHTAIFPHSYRYRDTKDCSLGPRGDLRVYLEGLAAAENVQRYVEQYPFGQRAITESNLSWGFYRRIIGTDSDQPKDDASSSSTCQ